MDNNNTQTSSQLRLFPLKKNDNEQNISPLENKKNLISSSPLTTSTVSVLQLSQITSSSSPQSQDTSSNMSQLKQTPTQSIQLSSNSVNLSSNKRRSLRFIPNTSSSISTSSSLSQELLSPVTISKTTSSISISSTKKHNTIQSYFLPMKKKQKNLITDQSDNTSITFTPMQFINKNDQQESKNIVTSNDDIVPLTQQSRLDIEATQESDREINLNPNIG